jgi:integrase
MSERRVSVWVQRFPDRKNLVLQWTDPDTGRRMSRASGTANRKEAEKLAADLEYELTHGKYQEASRMTWERFRELFEEEYAAGTRPDTRRNYEATFDLFERLCKPGRLRAITERTISLFVAAMRKEPGRRTGSDGMMASTIKVRLQFLHTALAWAFRQKMITAVPGFPTVKVPKTYPQAVPTESVERMLAKSKDDPQMQAYLLSGWLAGLRLNEALALEWERTETAPYLDVGRRRIVFPANFVKAVKDQWLPLDPALQEVLERLPQHGPKVFRFVNSRGEPLRSGAISQRVVSLAKRAGVRLTMKSLRTGFGCRYAGKVPAQVLQRLLRHGNIRTSVEFYTNVDDALEEAVFGPKRNDLRNTAETETRWHDSDGDVSHSQESVNRAGAN